MIRIFTNLLGNFRLQRLANLLAEGRSAEVVGQTDNLSLTNGRKQIAMIYRAYAYYEMNDLSSSFDSFELARNSEVKWGGRKSNEDQKYIINLCSFYQKLIRLREGRTSPKVVEDALKVLYSSSASVRIKEELLPPPDTPSIMRYLVASNSGD